MTPTTQGNSFRRQAGLPHPGPHRGAAARFIFGLVLVFAVAAQAFTDDALQKAQDQFRAGRYEEAVALYEKAARQSALWTQAKTGLVRVLLESGQYERAEKVCAELLAKLPEKTQVLTLRAKIFERTGRYAQARADFKAAVQRAPELLEARLGLGKMQWEWGEKDAARRTLGYFISYYRNHQNLTAADLTLTAQACVYLGRFKDANTLFQDANRADPTYWRALVQWGELMLSKYNVPAARGLFADALKINQNSAAAIVGLAQASGSGRIDPAAIDKLLQRQPTYVPAYDYRAGIDIARQSYKQAVTKLDKALKANPNSLTTRTLRAIAFYFQDDQANLQKEKKRVLKTNPSYGRFYHELAEALARRYLFRESVHYYEKALTLDPELWAARAGLGTSLSRLGQEGEAKQQLEQAFTNDSYNKHVANLLTLFDELPQYKVHETRYLTLKLHADDDPVLAPYATALADESFASLLKLYPISTEQKVIVEIFPSHDDFAVRCFGLPGAQAFLGICFGNVVAMDSPRARSKGDFVWGETLWHELVHVTHLRLTGNRIPRWLAEGIAVFETTQARSYWAMRLEWPFIMALKHKRALPLKDLDSGFSRPGNPGEVSLSYFQASLMIEFIVNKFGRESLLAMFPKFKAGLKTPDVVAKVFDEDIDAFDARFRKYVAQKYRLDAVDYAYERRDVSDDPLLLAALIKKKPNNPFVNYRYGMYYKDAGETEKALFFLNKAKSLFPEFVDKHNPYAALAEIYAAKGDTAKAVEELRALTSLNGKDTATLQRLADWSMQLHNYDAAIEALTKMLYISPFLSDVHRQLALACLAAGRTDAAISELQVNLLTRPQDLAGAHCDLADAYLQAGRKAEAKQSALSALEIAPDYERAQQILLATIE